MEHSLNPILDQKRDSLSERDFSMQRILILGQLVGVNPEDRSSLFTQSSLAISSDDFVAEIEYLFEPKTLPPEVLIKMLKLDSQITGIVCPLSQSITAEVFAQAPQLKVVANIAVGLDNIDLEAARHHQVRVAHTPGVLTEATADLAWTLLLGGARRLVEGDQLARSGTWRGWEIDQLLGGSVGGRGPGEGGGKALGIIGLGAIGEAIARRAQGFRLDVYYYSRTRKPTLETQEGWTYMPLDLLVSHVDYLVLSAPLTSQTYHLMNRERLQLMKPNAYLINIGRGPLIDEEALIDLLEQGHLGGAGLDVYEQEPHIPQRLRALPQVTLCPHLGSATWETRREMSRLAILGAQSIVSGIVHPDAHFAV